MTAEEGHVTDVTAKNKCYGTATHLAGAAQNPGPQNNKRRGLDAARTECTDIQLNATNKLKMSYKSRRREGRGGEGGEGRRRRRRRLTNYAYFINMLSLKYQVVAVRQQ